MARLSPSAFKIPTDKLRSGYYTDRYFLRTRNILYRDHRQVEVGYQFFPREDSVICGIDEAIAILKTCAGRYRDQEKSEKLYGELREVQWRFQDAGSKQSEEEILKWGNRRTHIRHQLNSMWESGWDKLRVWALHDGARVKRNEAVLAIRGDPNYFAHLETPLLGAIARATSTATAVSKVVEAAHGKVILFFSARFDHYWVQATDGYAALKAGAFAVSTDANADYWGAESMGTMPHFIIGCYGGDTVAASLAFDQHTEDGVNRIALVDWDNDCIQTTRQIIEAMIVRDLGKTIRPSEFKQYAKHFIGPGKGKLWGVRFDTSADLRDRSVHSKGPDSCGVSPELIRTARREFNRWGCRNLKIVATGGFNEKRIREFENKKIPVDVYGVGSSLLRSRVDITADIVEYNGTPCAKIGRKKSDWSHLERVG